MCNASQRRINMYAISFWIMHCDGQCCIDNHYREEPSSVNQRIQVHGMSDWWSSLRRCWPKELQDAFVLFYREWAIESHLRIPIEQSCYSNYVVCVESEVENQGKRTRLFILIQILFKKVFFNSEYMSSLLT